jgi:hypothetical protein
MTNACGFEVSLRVVFLRVILLFFERRFFERRLNVVFPLDFLASSSE